LSVYFLKDKGKENNRRGEGGKCLKWIDFFFNPFKFEPFDADPIDGGKIPPHPNPSNKKYRSQRKHTHPNPLENQNAAAGRPISFDKQTASSKVFF
jgi:hypothetical protein